MASDLVTAARRMGHERWVALRLFEMLGGWARTTTDAPDAARLFATHGSIHAWHGQLWHDRIPAIPDVTLDAVTAPESAPMAAFVSAAAVAGDTIHRLVGVYRVILPQQIAVHRRWRRAVDAATDAPTARVLDLVLRDELDAWEAGEAVLRSLVADRDAVERAGHHQTQLELLLLSARAASPAGAAARGTATRS